MYYTKVAPVKLPNIWKFWKNIKAKPPNFHTDKTFKENKRGKKKKKAQNKKPPKNHDMPEEAWTMLGLMSSA